MERLSDAVFLIGGRHFNKENLSVYTLNEANVQALDFLISGNEPPPELREAAEELLQSELLSTRSSDPARVDFVPDYAGFRIVLGEVCNLRCSHCFVLNREHAPITMGVNDLYEILDATFRYGYDRQLKYHFFGGEPLMMRKQLRAAVRYLESAAKHGMLKPLITLTTNGTMIGDDDVAFFAKHQVSVGVSLDGPREVNDRIRGAGTYDLAVESFLCLTTG